LLSAQLVYTNPPTDRVFEEKKNLQTIHATFTLGSDDQRFILAMLEDSRWLIAELTTTAPVAVEFNSSISNVERDIAVYSLSIDLTVVPLMSGAISLPGLKVSFNTGYFSLTSPNQIQSLLSRLFHP
jgi:hypothetical protein